MAPFAFVVPDRFVNANQFYDFSLTPSFSDLAITQTELAARAVYRFPRGYAVAFEYRLADVDDDQPYIEDLTGSLDLYTLTFARTF